MIDMDEARELVGRRLERLDAATPALGTGVVLLQKAVAPLCVGTDVSSVELATELAMQRDALIEGLSVLLPCVCAPVSRQVRDEVVGRLDYVFWLGFEMGRAAE